MKPTDHIEERIKGFSVETNAEKDKMIKLLLAVEAQRQCGSFRLRLAIGVGIAAVAAGVVILLAMGLLGFGKREFTRPINIATVPNRAAVLSPQLPGELMSVMSLDAAFRTGGMKAVEEQFKQIEEKTIIKPHERVTIDQLLCESGYCDENPKERTL